MTMTTPIGSSLISLSSFYSPVVNSTSRLSVPWFLNTCPGWVHFFTSASFLRTILLIGVLQFFFLQITPPFLEEASRCIAQEKCTKSSLLSLAPAVRFPEDPRESDIQNEGERYSSQSKFRDTAMVGLNAMQRANSTLEDFVSANTLSGCTLQLRLRPKSWFWKISGLHVGNVTSELCLINSADHISCFMEWMSTVHKSYSSICRCFPSQKVIFIRWQSRLMISESLIFVIHEKVGYLKFLLLVIMLQNFREDFV